jgi:hypothetical protein
MEHFVDISKAPLPTGLMDRVDEFLYSTGYKIKPAALGSADRHHAGDAETHQA